MLTPGAAPGEGLPGRLGLPGIEGFLEPGVNRVQGGAGRKELGHPDLLELGDIGVGDDSAAEDDDFIESALVQELQHPRKERHMRAGKERKANGVGILLQRGLGDLLRRLVQARVDDLEATVTQGARDDLGPTIVTVETRLGDHHSIPALHAAGTLAIGPRARPTGPKARSRRSPGWTASPSGEYTLSVAPRQSQRRSDIRVLLGAAIAVVVGGILIAAAILAIPSRAKLPNAKVALPFGLAADIHMKVREGGPVNIAGLSGDDGFWVTTEHHQLVARLVAQPKPAACTLRWRGSKNTFPCDNQPVQSVNLARYRSFTQARGPRKGLFMVELRKVLPAPG